MKSRVWRIIPSEFRGRAIWVAITIFARALLNFVGIAMLVPVLILILDSDSIANNEQLNAIYVNYGFTSYISFILAICGIAISVIILKNVAILWMYRYERDFIYSLYKHISIRPAPPPLSPFSPPDLDRRVDSPALSGRGSRPSGRTSG